MELESKVRASGNVPAEVAHSSSDLILVADTSFLTRFSARHIWAYQAVLMTQSIANQKGKRWLWRAPVDVVREYNRFLATGQVDKDYSIPLAQSPLEKLFDEFSGMLSFNVALGAVQEASRAPRDYPGTADISVLVFAVGLAMQGADVYVASYDFSGVIAPARDLGRKLKRQGFSLEPLPPSEVDMKCFTDAGLGFGSVISNVAISQLQEAVSTPLSYPIVIFEAGVQSGNAVFDAGVGVVQKEYFRPLKLPQEYEPVAGNFKAVPVVKVGSLSDLSALKQLKNSFRQFGAAQLVVVEERAPYSPLLVSVFDKAPQYMFRADIDFLFHQTSSAFARGNFLPVARRAAARVPIPK